MKGINDAVRDIAVHLALNQVAHAKRERRAAKTFQEAQAWQNEESEVCDLLRRLRFHELRAEEKKKFDDQYSPGGTD